MALFRCVVHGGRASEMQRRYSVTKLLEGGTSLFAANLMQDIVVDDNGRADVLYHEVGGTLS